MHQVAMLERQTLSYVGNCSTVTTNALFQADGVEVYDSDYDDVPNSQPSLMANISSSDLDVLAEVHNPDNMDNNMTKQAVQAMRSFEQSSVVNHLETEITSDSNIIPYSQYVTELQQAALKEKESLMQTVTLLKNDFKKEESRNIDKEIALEKKIKQLDNIVFKRDQSTQTKAQQLEPKLYDGNVIKNTSAIVIPDSEDTLMLAEESHFEKQFVPQTELSTEQAFWSQNSMNSYDPSPSYRSTKVEVPKELPKVSMVNTSLKKLKHHLVGFDVVVKERTTATTIIEGSWGFKHTKACFRDEIIPFVKALKDLFNTFDKYLIDELSEVQNVFHQMEQAVEQHYIVEQARTSNPLDNALAYACMYTKQIQELLVYVSDTCLSSSLKSEKLVAITPMNKDKKVTFAKTSTTSENNTQIHVDVHQTQTTNKPSVHSTNVKCSTNASRSKPCSETKNNRIMQPLSSNQKYQKVEAHTRNAKPSLTKENSESKSVCLTCNKCYFDARHDFCVVQHLSEVNDRARAKAVKSIKMKEWKPTGKMFKNVGYKWVPTGRTFTIVGTKCPLTRFTSTKIVPPRKPVKSTVITNIKPSSASQWRPKETNHASSSSAPKIVESRTANHLEPNNHMGSNVSISTCSSSVQCRSYKSYLGNWIRAALHI
ncbi:hypothetical protein Tco_0922242 [Tanacetum coccineum]|uniref:Integrase, catalytic region, zinc finger, CCHC-type, peptidase aspartic, catalytic n=1 Tax=Tanacetum coccineum TaxID=301880 RepID=A0ABQ5CYK4_9ASTR